MIRVLAADDNFLVRRGLRELFRTMTGYSITGMAASSDDVLVALDHSRFDLVLLDPSIKGITCRELVEEIRVVDARVPILVFGVFNDFLTVKRILRSGASGIVSKKSGVDTLMLAMRKVATGGRFIDSLIGEKLMLSSSPSLLSAPDECLSPRELQVMILYAQGLNVAAIATELSISDKTVSTHKVRLMRKLNIRNDAELVRCAIDHRLLN